MEWPPSRQMAALYQSPGPNGIGFARYASSGAVTPELWENIAYTEAEAERRPEDPAVESWGDDMELLRELLRVDGVTEKRKVTLEISFTEVIPRSVEIKTELDVDDIEDLVAGYGFADSKYAKLVQKKFSAEGEEIELLHDEVDHIEVLDPEEEVPEQEPAVEQAPPKQPLDLEEMKELVKTALNSGSGDSEWSTLVQIGDMLGLEYDDEKDTYQ